MTRRSTIRARLTSFYGVMFVLCGILLLVVSFAMVRSSLVSQEGNTDQLVIERYGYSQNQVKAFYSLPVPPAKNAPVAATAGSDDISSGFGAVSGTGTADNPKNVGDVIVGVQQDMRADTLHQLVVGFSVALAIAAFASVLVGWFAAGRALAPVGRLTAKAQKLSEANLHQRIGSDGPQDELKELADTLDGMLGRLEVAFNAQRNFAANVSHELRTPLSIIRAEADVALLAPDVTDRESHLAESVIDAVDRTEALLDSLLALARSESTMNERTEVDLAELAGDVVSERIEAANAAHVLLDLDLESDPGDAPIEGDRWLLERLVANLVDNGIHHNIEGGWVKVSVERSNGDGVLRVSNSGEALTAEQVTDIMQPFRRAAGETGPGYGLGMTIVQSVAKAHDGSVEVAPRPGGGLDVTVQLPVARVLATV